MSRKQKTLLAISITSLAAFALWTLCLKFADVQAIGPQGSKVGFASLNQFFHKLTGVHMTLYIITDWLGLIPFFSAAGFGVLGLCQWIKQKSIAKVDRSILVLGVFYIVVIAFYLFFEEVVINYRPVLIEGFLEASYPSSTTLLTFTVMPSAAIELDSHIKKPLLKKLVISLIIAFTAFMVVGRLISGVHWLSDIIGGTLLSVGLTSAFALLRKKQN